MDIRSTEETNASISLHEYPLTRGQAALWFHHKVAPEAAAYNLAGAVAIPGDTELEALRSAFRRLAERHPMLRTSFSAQHGKPVQRVHPSIEVVFHCEDGSRWSMAQLDEALAKEIYHPFDLEQGPTWRVVVFQQAPISGENDVSVGPQDHLVLLVLHHMIGDLWSIAIILSEVAALYREETTGVQASLKPLRASYADHVNKELERLTGLQSEISWDYWRTVLSGELSPLSLPTDRPRPPVSTGRGAVQTVLLDKELTNGLRALVGKQRVALYTVLLTAFQTLLHRYTGQNDILVGFPKAGRSSATARVVGYFVNQTVVRADFTENPRFIDLLNGVQKSIEEGARHDWYPFSLLVQRLQPTRDLSRSPLIQAVFSWQQAPRLIPRENAGAFVLGQADHAIDLDGLFVRSVHLSHRVAPFDLMMLAAEAPDGLVVTIEYATDLFDAVTIARMAECYHTLLESITAAPEQRVSDLTVLPESEREQLVEDWNATAAPYPTQACLHSLFEQQVERTPEIVAVASGEEPLTYRQLNQRANQLAHFLQEQGVGPDTLVGVCLDPSVQMVIALLGILKAGGAYLPLDPTFPEKRLAFMLTDARPALLLTRQRLRPRLPEFTGRVVCLDAYENRLRTQPQTDPSSHTTPDHLAYVIYTSGSTGQPKGAALAHRGVVSLLTDFQQRQAIQPGDACSWWTSPSFDVSVYEIFSPLLVGGSLQVIPESLRLDAPRLLDWFQAYHIRSAYLPPFFLADFTVWVESHPSASPLRRLLVGVEPIPDALLTRLSAQIPALCILNGYGPTETTICSTLYVINTAHPHPGNTPIGRPVANTQIYLLDQALQPVPVGAVGELYIGGVGLARGYLNQPELTAQRFILSPFRSGERLYSTGDLARYLPDGNLMFVGRSDTQVKFHGVRIELGEIEATLTQHHLVRQAAVLLQEQASAEKHLVAYVVSAQEARPSAGELRQFLNERLSRAMVPSAFVILDAFPLTSTGKVDRKALPLPYILQSKQGNAYRAPQTNAEQILVAIWQQVLGVEPVGVDDNFFELGGDSIMSIEIVCYAEEAGLHLSPQHVFQAPTVAGLAALADASVPIRKQSVQENIEAAIPLTPIQRWFFERNFPNLHHWNQSMLFVTPQPLDPIHLRSAVSDILIQHDTLRLRFTNGPLGWQQTCAASNVEVPFDVIDLSVLTDAQQADAIETHVADQQRSLDLSTGPLIRVVYFVLGTDHPGRLLIVIHHLAVDGVSWRILLEDLQSAYRQRERGQSTQLPHKTTSFQAWARCLADFAQSPELKQEASFWLHTAGAHLPELPVDQLPFDQPLESLNFEGTAHHVSVSLGREETQALLRESSGAYGTEIGDILLAALARAFQRWTGIEALWIDLEAHGRENIFDEIDLTRTVGWFTTLYPARLDLDHSTEPGQAIKTIKEQLRRIPHHGLGYGLLRYLCPDPTLSERFKSIPPAQVSFNYLGQLPRASIDGLVSTLVPEPLGYQRCSDAQRSHLIEINAAILQGELRIDWVYSFRVHSRHTIEQVAGIFIDELRILIAHCRSPEAVGYTPSDFPDAGLSQAELDTIIRLTSRSKVSIPKRNLEAVYPLSPMQQGMVFHTLYTPESGVYFEQTIFTIQGQFDVSAFEKAWQRVSGRHTILRTSFAWQGLDRMLQVVHKDARVPLELQDWRNIPAAEQQARFERHLTTERSRGFDLSIPPLLRLAILQTADDTYHVLLNHHHVLLDGWSVPLLFKEVFAFYDAFTRDQDLALPPARPYSDYIAWLQTRDLAAAEAFWHKELAGFVPATWNPVQPSSSPSPGASRPAVQDERLSPHTTAALQVLARQQHLTIGTLVQGAWAILLSHYCQRDEVLFGVTVAGRPSELPGVVSMIGLFINTLPLRVHIAPQSRLLEWLQDIQDKTIEIQQYDYSPLTQIRGWSGVPHGSSLFDTILVLENYPIHTAFSEQFGRLWIGNIRSIGQTTYSLTVAVTPGQQLQLKILYDPARFEQAAIQGLLSHLIQVLENMVADPNQRLSALPLLTKSERDMVDDPSQTGLAPLFAQQAESAPEKMAATREEEFVPPSNPLEKYLARLWEKHLKTDQVGIHDNFFELGGDSLTGAICIYQLQDALGEKIPLAAIFNAPTVFELAGYLAQNHPDGVAQLLGVPVSTRVSTVPESPVGPTTLVPIQPYGSKPPLFCIHPAGGIVFPYYTLAHYLGKDQPLYGIQDPGLYHTQSAPKSIEAMAVHYLEALKTVQPEGPYRLLGWSAGGVVAYEMAQQLIRQGHTVDRLIILDTGAPVPARALQPQPSLGGQLQQVRSWFQRLPNRIRGAGSAIKPIASYVRSGLFLLAASAKRSGTPSGGKPAIVDLLGWAGLDTWRAHLLKEAEVASIVSQDVSLLLVEMPAVRRVLELVREHSRLARRYTAERYGGRITLFRAVRSRSSKKRDEDPMLGWGGLAEGGVDVHSIQANHVALLVKPHIELLAQELRICLDQSRRYTSDSTDTHSQLGK
jgi:amino acid adenylation domain-containing protein/non-ribosomal peptide synthase protein (TIGR01720 family)